MDFGRTIEEQYAKISAVNKLIEKFSKVFSIIFLLSGISMVFFSLNGDGNKITLLIVSLIVTALGYLCGKHIAGKMYGWAWISFCEKHNPAGLAKSLSKATHNSAVEGYVFGGTSGAKAAAFGVVIVFFFLFAFYIWKGTFYMIKYWNLPKKETQLKKQLERKQANQFDM